MSVESIGQGIEYSRFAIYETPYCVWAHDLSATNREFLEQFEPDYFKYQATLHYERLVTKDRQYAAVALRTTFCHALETFFALLGAAVQAPDCPVGYVTLYQPRELRALVQEIGRKPILTKLPNPVTWESLARRINALEVDPQAADAVWDGFARVWSRLAQDFVSAETTDEYNTLKHGLRVRFGGFSLRVGIEPSYGIPPPDAEMTALRGSEFGTTSFMAEKIGNPATHRRIAQRSLNWSPDNMLAGIGLLVMSIHNVVAWLRVENGAQKRLTLRVPESLGVFDLPWQDSVPTRSFRVGPDIRWEDIEPFSKDQILEVYSSRLPPSEERSG